MTRYSLLVLCLSATAAMGGCGDGITDSEPLADDSLVVVSNPLGRPMLAVANAAQSASMMAGDEQVYISLVPGTVPSGGIATVRNTRTGGSVSAAMAAGGFDPVALEARGGDTLQIAVHVVGSTSPVLLPAIVPTFRPPIIVRTDPPPKKRDVPLNAAIMIVFSEPMDEQTIGGIHVRRGGTVQNGRVTLSEDGLRAVLRPDDRLEPNADYVVVIPREVRDLDGDEMGVAVSVTFTTGSTTIVASVASEEAALFVNPYNGKLRSFSFDAVLDQHGEYSGSFTTFYPEGGFQMTGRVTCFSIVAGRTAWVAGIVDDATDPQEVGWQRGWRAVDRGPAHDVPDQLSLQHPLGLYRREDLDPPPPDGTPATSPDPLGGTGLGSAGEFCSMTPEFDPRWGGIDIALEDLIGGNIVVTGEASPTAIPTVQMTPEDHGNGQADTVLAVLPRPLRVLVTRDGAPMQGVRVHWTIAAGSAHMTGWLATDVSTDASGIASATVTLGRLAGAIEIVAWADGAVGNPVVFTVTALPGGVTQLWIPGYCGWVVEVSCGDGQIGVVNSPLENDYMVGAIDAYGNKNPTAVQWTVTSGGGSLGPGVWSNCYDMLCDAGMARVSHTLGPDYGMQTVEASAPGATPVTFTAFAASAVISAGWADDDYYCQNGFRPADVTVPVGTPVVWTWPPCYFGGIVQAGYYSRRHDVVFEDGVGSSSVQQAGSHVRTFESPGTYRYRCTIHSTDFESGEVGIVTVVNP